MTSFYWIAIVSGVIASATGMYGVWFAYSHRYKNNLSDIINLRDQLIKGELYAKLSDGQHEVFDIIETAFSQADQDLASVIRTVLGEERARNITKVLKQGSING
jgi:hypothetical protein